jgi:ATP-binding cassette ChvD family protein
LKNIYLSFYYGAKIGVLGLNGAGKSSLLKIIAGEDKSFQGEVVFSPGYNVGYLPQEPQLDDSKTVKEIVMEGVGEVASYLKEYEEIGMKFAEPMDDDEMNRLIERQGELTELIDQHDAWELDAKLERAMDALNCPEGETPVSVLSGGERRRVALCRLLLQEPDILLLDEPTNHLDAESIQWLEMHLRQYKGTVIAVTHDRYFLDNVAGWILELDRGEGIPWQGNYSSWLEQKTKRMEMEEKQESKRRKTLERELEWIRMAPKARQAKGKARLSAYERMMSEDTKEKEAKLEIFIPNGPRLGNRVIEAKNVSKAFGDKLLYENLNFSLPPAGIVGIIGPNGCGKTTLMKILAGLIHDYHGIVKVGGKNVGTESKASLAYLPDCGVFPARFRTIDCIKYFADFFKDFDRMKAVRFAEEFGLDLNQRIKTMSKGMQEKLQLLLVMSRKADIYLLDEPLGGVDPAAREVILDIIMNNYKEHSTVVISTHLVNDLEHSFDHVMMLGKGKILVNTSIDNIRETGKSVEEVFKEVIGDAWEVD